MRPFLVVVIAITLLGLIAGQSARAAVVAPLPKSPSVTSSGIGLPQNLNRAGSGVLANAAYYQRALKSKLWRHTPDGLVYGSCFYSVPNGSKVDSIRGRITLPSGAVRSLSRCAYPRLVSPTASTAATVSSAATAMPGTTSRIPATDGWLYDFTTTSTPGPLAEVSGNYAVPTVPNESSSAVTDYAFTSFEEGDSILQPVIGWGYSDTEDNSPPVQHAGQYLWMAAYYVWGGNGVAATFDRVSAGDTISNLMQASGCNSSGGGCTWYIGMTDENSGINSDFTVVSSPVYRDYSGGAFESYNATDCNMLFGNAHLVWRNLAASYFTNASTGATATFKPTFSLNPFGTEEKPCSMHAANYTSETGGDILWTP